MLTPGRWIGCHSQEGGQEAAGQRLLAPQGGDQYS